MPSPAARHSHPPCSAAILAGGAAKRMGGAHKALLDVAGQSILGHLLDALHGRFAEVLLVAKEAGAYAELPMRPERPWRLVLDALPDRSSLTGIHAALAHSRTEHVFVTACDTPLVRPALLDALLDRLRPEDDVVLPLKPDGYFEPLCALYSRRCLPHIAAQLAGGDYKIIRFFPKVRVSPLPVQTLLAADPELISFMNANTPEDLAALRCAAEQVRSTQEQP